jgi:hypothetical protein
VCGDDGGGRAVFAIGGYGLTDNSPGKAAVIIVRA